MFYERCDILTKITNECFKCKNRFCSVGIISCDDNGNAFNEVACAKHTDDLYKEADRILGKDNGVMRLHVSTTSTLSRRILKEMLLNNE